MGVMVPRIARASDHHIVEPGHLASRVMQTALVGWAARTAMLFATEARVAELHGGKTPRASTLFDRQALYSPTVAVQVVGS